MNVEIFRKVIEQALLPIIGRIRAMASRCTITRVDDGGVAQIVQVTALATDRIPESARVQMFGMSAHPPAGSTALLISIGGSRTHCVVIGADHESRPRDLLPGESQLYNQFGDFVYLRENGESHIKARSKVVVEAPEAHVIASAKITLQTPLVEATNDLTVGGNFSVAGMSQLTGAVATGDDVTVAGAMHAIGAISSATSIADPAGDMAEIRVVYNGHKHDGLGGSESNPPTTLMT
ncbi:phage baseplate assembly protein V [Hydrocarboniphaga effusa]|uniref:phage baseplate assembly protein V n=1 Tax=Hydrocarboniphaga effusa TaxID=243629 RepID=UPI003BAD61FC